MKPTPKHIGLTQLNGQSPVVRRFIAAPMNQDSKQLDTVANARFIGQLQSTGVSPDIEISQPSLSPLIQAGRVEKFQLNFRWVHEKDIGYGIRHSDHRFGNLCPRGSGLRHTACAYYLKTIAKPTWHSGNRNYKDCPSVSDSPPVGLHT